MAYRIPANYTQIQHFKITKWLFSDEKKNTRIYSVENVFGRITDVSAVDLIQIRFKNFEHQFYYDKT